MLTASSLARPATPQLRALALFVIVAAVATRVSYASSKSLVLDEFHSYYHATSASLAALTSQLRLDNHPPLSFLFIRQSAAALGDGELALRLPALLCGLLEIALVLRIALAVGARTFGAALAAGLLAASALHFDYGTQVRMYAPFALTITVVLAALITLLSEAKPSRAPSVLLALSAAGALYTHYFAIQYLSVLITSAVIAALLTSNGARLRRLALPLTAAAAIFAPWAMSGFRAQLAHALPPGGDDVSAAAFAESLMHLFAHNVSLGGPTGRWVFALCAALGLLLAARGALLLLRTPESRIAGILLASAAFAVPLASWLLARIHPRSGYTWHYILPSAAPACVLAGVAARSVLERSAAVAVFASGCVLIALHLARPATEDFRGAVHYGLELAQPETPSEVVRLVSVECQPPLFPQGQPYDYYAPRLAVTPPDREPMLELGKFMVSDPKRLLASDRVVVVGRSLSEEHGLTMALNENFATCRTVSFGYGLEVREFRH